MMVMMVTDTHSTSLLQFTLSSCSMSALAWISAFRQAVLSQQEATIRDVQPFYTHVEVRRANATDGLSMEKFGDVGHKYMCVVRVMSV